MRMKASNNDGIWNEEGISVAITIAPPFWETWWFRGIILLALGGTVFAGYRLRVRSIEARSRALEAEVKQRTAALEEETEQRLMAEEALRQSETEKAVIAERNRLARELHDAVSQSLFSASLLAEALPNSWDRDQQEGRMLLAKLQQLSRGALAEMRTLLIELRPSALVETSFDDLLRQLADATTGREGLPVDVQVECDCELPADVHIALYRIAQEAMNNVIKHARANQVEIWLGCTACAPGETERQPPKRITLLVRDDGKGFDPGNIPPDHLGIGIMHERAASIGASLSIASQPGQGTQVTVVWEADQ